MKKHSMIFSFFLFAGIANAQEGIQGKIGVEGVEISATDDSVYVQMDMDFSALHVSANRTISLFPSVQTDAEICRLPGVEVRGRKQYIQYLREEGTNASGAQVIRRKNGERQRLHYRASVPVKTSPEWVRLYLDEDSCGCLREVLASRNRLLAEENFKPKVFVPHWVYIQPEAETRKARNEQGAAYIDFPVNKTDIRPDYRNNRAELAKIENTINRIKGDADVSITRIIIKGYASPEGSYVNNRRLAEGRTRALVDYLKKEYPLDAGLFKLDYEAEDWAGLRAFIEKGNLKEKDALLELVDSDINADTKEHRLRADYPEAYRMLLADCFPALRHTDYVVEYTVRGFDVEEARQIIWKEPQKLSLQEMYAVAQTYEVGSTEYKEIFETAVRLFPDDEVANLNAANAAMARRDLPSASRYLEKAGSTALADYARGVLAGLQGDYQVALILMEKAKAGGVNEADEALRQIQELIKNKR